MAVFLKSHSMVLSHVIVLMRTNFNIFLVCHMSFSFDEKIKLKNNTQIFQHLLLFNIIQINICAVDRSRCLPNFERDQ